jgi:hypothetical protein
MGARQTEAQRRVSAQVGQVGSGRGPGADMSERSSSDQHDLARSAGSDGQKTDARFDILGIFARRHAAHP